MLPEKQICTKTWIEKYIRSVPFVSYALQFVFYFRTQLRTSSLDCYSVLKKMTLFFLKRTPFCCFIFIAQAHNWTRGVQSYDHCAPGSKLFFFLKRLPRSQQILCRRCFLRFWTYSRRRLIYKGAINYYPIKSCLCSRTVQSVMTEFNDRVCIPGKGRNCSPPQTTARQNLRPTWFLI